MVRVLTGTTLEQAQASHWLMASTAGRPCQALWAAAWDVKAVQWQLLLDGAALKDLMCAARLFGTLRRVLHA